MKTDAIGWGSVRFKYTYENVQEIYSLLSLNHWDVIKVFDVVWNETFRDLDRDSASCVLGLIGKVNRMRMGTPLTADQVWEKMAEDASKNTFIFDSGKFNC